MQLTFCINDEYAKEETCGLSEVLKQLALNELDGDSDVDLLIVHEKTDGLETKDPRRIAADRRVAYVPYTRGEPTTSQPDGDRVFRLSELIGRFDNLIPPATRESLRGALGAASIELRWLPAIAVLCQGYLAVLAESVAIPRAALERMGWVTLKTDNELSADVLPELGKHRDEVQGKEWWSTVLGEDAIVLTELLRDEWAKDGEVPKTVSNLVDAIYGGDGPDAEVVAAAYLAIVDRLEGNSCRPS